ncbi:aminotransferase class I/II-fold pyridoxal phosphate-dependent enzyme [Vineibacter terrae]|uniref:aminotransferase class I/II-fold pyridoxal phosphate-dependent enzyme n=1 Tax=Vineibacter terrae TaxID=2586908 RepID=UPI002E31921F|nr:aminotransferase class I/II-fold pyridoxal phosphate-dependent enzyme [Vineibacter terrae]HEX2885474.1 aminotransferase class I/II-fold pyridoxal phosphate-dependent enzyme [Vineibacter terrae]
MNAIADLSTADLGALRTRMKNAYDAFRARGLKLDMTRGKPSAAQLDLANPMFSLPGNGDHFTEAGDDARNYGGVQGIAEVRALFAPIMGVPADQVVVGDNSSLALMHDCLAWALLKGVPGSAAPWSKEAAPAFICPVPGYDRHFALCEEYGIRMLPVPMTGHGPDMDAVEALAADPAVKGMWCVPKYSNPSGEVYDDATIRRLAAMRAGAPDFRLFWDNAYAVHHLTARRHDILNVMEACAAAGHADRPFIFASTSKITLAGAGLALFASSAANVRWYLARASKRTIGPDKLNQLRHLRFLRNVDGLHRHMDGHRALLAPKFDAVAEALEHHLAGLGAARWTRPEGGYFITVDAADGTARRVVALAKEAGLALTPAGATWPLGQDPHDRTLRIAPTFPSLEEVRAAAEGIALCIALAAVEKEDAGRSRPG